jgi:hypothetical protein
MASNTNTSPTPDSERATLSVPFEHLTAITAGSDCIDDVAVGQTFPDSTPGMSSDSWGRLDTLMGGSTGGPGTGAPNYDGHRTDGHRDEPQA